MCRATYDVYKRYYCSTSLVPRKKNGVKKMPPPEAGNVFFGTDMNVCFLGTLPYDAFEYIFWYRYERVFFGYIAVRPKLALPFLSPLEFAL